MSIYISKEGKAKYDELINKHDIKLPDDFMGKSKELWKELFEYDHHLQMIPLHSWMRYFYDLPVKLPDGLTIGHRITLLKYALITQVIGYSFEDQ